MWLYYIQSHEQSHDSKNKAKTTGHYFPGNESADSFQPLIKSITPDHFATTLQTTSTSNKQM